jgi:hypothetical protein
MPTRHAPVPRLVPDVLAVLPKARPERAPRGASSNAGQVPLRSRRCSQAIGGTRALSASLAAAAWKAAGVHSQDGGLVAMETQTLDSPLLTRDEAARYCRVGLRTFDRRVAPHVQPVSIGTRRFFDRRDIDTWLETQKDGRSLETGVRVSTRSASRTRVEGSTDPRARKILQELRSKRRESTPKLFPVAGCNPDPKA